MDVSRAGSLLRVSDPEFLRFGRRGAVAFIVLGCLLIAGWQWVAIDEPKELDRTYERRTGVGFYGARAQKYFYFLYYTGKFPITTGRSVKHLIWNEERAWEAIQSGPPDRVMDAARARAQGAGKRRIGLGRPRLLPRNRPLRLGTAASGLRSPPRRPCVWSTPSRRASRGRSRRGSACAKSEVCRYPIDEANRSASERSWR